MGKITLQQAAQWCGGQIDPKYKDVAFLGATNDTRKLQPGQLFIALQGARDGHEFIPAALEKGAAAVLCTHCDGDYPIHHLLNEKTFMERSEFRFCPIPLGGIKKRG
mgnify:CR=1 FL=1